MIQVFFYLFSPYVYLVQLFWVGVCVRTWVCVCESEKNDSKSSFIRLQRKTNTKFVFCHLIMNIFSTPFYSKRIIEILCTFQIPLCILICAIKLLGVFYSLILLVTRSCTRNFFIFLHFNFLFCIWNYYHHERHSHQSQPSRFSFEWLSGKNVLMSMCVCLVWILLFVVVC